VNLMAMVGETVNNTEAVWLNNMKIRRQRRHRGHGAQFRRGRQPDLESAEDGYFPILRSRKAYRTKPSKTCRPFQFTLTCEKGKS